MPDLICHRSTPSEHVRSVRVETHISASALSLSYRVEGDIGQLQLAPEPGGVRRDGLWRHSCFEAFLRTRGRTAYSEFNFAPNGDWAAYHFADYRQGMRDIAAEPPRIVCRRTPGILQVDVLLSIPQLEHNPAEPLQLALAAIVEERAEDGPGRLTYWALRHPADRPDFHARAGFASIPEPPFVV